MELQQLLDKASSFHEAGQQSEALRYYNQAFEKLTNEAALYAHTQPYTVKDEKTEDDEKIRTVMPRYFEVTKGYLKSDNTAYILLKNMAIIYHELDDIPSAIQALEQAIDLAPDGGDIGDAINGLENLRK